MKRTGPIPQLLRFYHALRRHRFVSLLASLILLFLAVAVVYLFQDTGQRLLTGLTVALLFDLMLLSAVNAVCLSRKTMVLAVSLAIPAALFSLLSALILATPGHILETPVHVINNLLAVVFITLAIVLVLDFLFRTRQVDVNMICASLCVYLLLGVVWASLYSLCGAFQADSFIYAYEDEIDGRNADQIDTTSMVLDAEKIPLGRRKMAFGGEKSLIPIYFSFVTLTTLGYGDMVPVSPPARILAILEAVVGQIYLTVLVARLVGLHIVHVTTRSSDDPS